MPPDPVIALIAFVGLILYAVVGSLTAVGWMRLIAGKEITRQNDFYHLHHREPRFNGDNSAKMAESRAWNHFAALAIFWPFTLAGGLAGALAAVGVCAALAPIVLVCAVPILIGKQIGKYVAQTQLKELA